ncbi:unnamed protein product, partial [Protopolystoma xenopodis]
MLHGTTYKPIQLVLKVLSPPSRVNATSLAQDRCHQLTQNSENCLSLRLAREYLFSCLASLVGGISVGCESTYQPGSLVTLRKSDGSRMNRLLDYIIFISERISMLAIKQAEFADELSSTLVSTDIVSDRSDKNAMILMAFDFISQANGPMLNIIMNDMAELSHLHPFVRRIVEHNLSSVPNLCKADSSNGMTHLLGFSFDWSSEFGLPNPEAAIGLCSQLSWIEKDPFDVSRPAKLGSGEGEFDSFESDISSAVGIKELSSPLPLAAAQLHSGSWASQNGRNRAIESFVLSPPASPFQSRIAFIIGTNRSTQDVDMRDGSNTSYLASKEPTPLIDQSVSGANLD